MSKCYVSKLIQIAENEVGYKEKKSNSNLYDKTANAGSGNWTKYAYEFDTKYPNFYNGKKNGYDWCDVFVDWCFVTAFGEANAMRLLGQPNKSLGAGCGFSARYYQAIGRFYTSNPQIGDQIFFGNSSSVNHTGIVYHVDNTYVYTIEGNCDQMVSKRKYAINYSNIYGYGRPAYDKEASATTKPVTSEPTVTKPTATSTTTYTNYTVTKGDTLTKIAKLYDTTINAIASANNIKNLNLIYPGQILNIPVTSSSASTAATIANRPVSSTVSTTANSSHNNSKFDSTYRYGKSYKVTTSNGVNVRKGAGTSAQAIGTIPYGTKVMWYGYYQNVDGMTWKYVNITGGSLKGKDGWIAAQYLG